MITQARVQPAAIVVHDQPCGRRVRQRESNVNGRTVGADASRFAQVLGFFV